MTEWMACTCHDDPVHCPNRHYGIRIAREELMADGLVEVVPSSDPPCYRLTQRGVEALDVLAHEGLDLTDETALPGAVLAPCDRRPIALAGGSGWWALVRTSSADCMPAEEWMPVLSWTLMPGGNDVESVVGANMLQMGMAVIVGGLFCEVDGREIVELRHGDTRPGGVPLLLGSDPHNEPPPS